MATVYRIPVVVVDKWEILDDEVDHLIINRHGVKSPIYSFSGEWKVGHVDIPDDVKEMAEKIWEKR